LKDESDSFQVNIYKQPLISSPVMVKEVVQKIRKGNTKGVLGSIEMMQV
jgi:hypothetical protein